MIMWELLSGVPPFDDRPHDIQLSLNICRDKRPEFSQEIIKNTPECYINLMKECWDSDPLKRPKASDIWRIIGNWWVYVENYYVYYWETYVDIKNIKENIDEIIQEKMYLKDEKLNDDIKEFWKSDKALAQGKNNNTSITLESNKSIRQSHPLAYRTSRLLDFTKKLNEILNQEEKAIFDYKDDQNIESGETGISQSIGKHIFFLSNI